MRVALLVAVALLFPAAASAQSEDFPAGTETASSGIVSATLRWDGGESGPANTTLTITRNGAVAFSQRIADVVCDGCLVSPEATGDLDVLDLDGDGEAEVVVTAYTGGEHCCLIMGAYDFRPATGTYSDLVADWREEGYGFRDLEDDGIPEVVTRDARFDEAFHTTFAPPAVFEYKRTGGEPDLVNITRIYPGLIRQNAAQAKRKYAHLRRGAGGFVAAYVADQFLLGHGTAGVKELDRQIRRGSLGRPHAAAAYRKRLLKLLRRYGYR